MPKEKAPQFFKNPPKARSQSTSLRTKVAIYHVKSLDGGNKPVEIAVECIEGGGNVPRNAASFVGIPKPLDFEKEIGSIAAVAASVLEKLKALRPGEVEIEFGIELGGEMGIPMVTKGEAKTNFKVTLKWKGSPGKGD